MRTQPKKSARRLQRAIQTVSLLLFLGLLALTVSPLPDILLPTDLFLRLDPLAATIPPLAVRQWIASLAPGLGIVLLAFFAGRIFCGYICPMGTTLDLARTVLPGKTGAGERRAEKTHAASGPAVAEKPEEAALPVPPADRPSERPARSLPSWLRRSKYLFLAGILGAALLGVNAAFWASPIALITRFYALLVHPLLALAGNKGLALTRPLLEALDWTSLSYWQISLRRFDTLYFVAGFFGLLFWLERIRPRFWCRYLCPAGALLALFSLRPFWRRTVRICTGCGRCARDCPMEAIDSSGRATLHGECLTCRACVDVCPVRGTAFRLHARTAPQDGELQPGDGPSDAPARSGAGPGEETAIANTKDLSRHDDRRVTHAYQRPGGRLPASMLPSRRAFLFSAGAGAVFAAVQLSGAHSLLSAEAKGLLWPAECIRPPGALPEPDFLGRCIRCGQCMKVCPTNGLQPSWRSAGPEGMFSPVLAARRGPCEPNCNACGAVCPTGAIQSLPLEEKRWAKLGTAVIMRESCLAWAEDKRCVVCEEVCPYGAIASVQTPGAKVAVPVVRAASCYGCGYCEQFCPVRVPAIVVRPLNALRLSDGNYQETGRSMGLTLRPSDKKRAGEGSPDALPEGGLPPGFTE